MEIMLTVDWVDSDFASLIDHSSHDATGRAKVCEFERMAGRWRAKDFFAEDLLEDGDNTKANAYHNALEAVGRNILEQLDALENTTTEIICEKCANETATYRTDYDHHDEIEKTGWWWLGGKQAAWLGFTYAQAQETLESGI